MPQKTQGQTPSLGHPMDLPVEVAGNFMELRSNHFHSGLDLKTNGRVGQPVKATGDGWVSRIKISPWGYGKAVYIDHPSGYTTVYGHLDRLHGTLAAAVLDLQYSSRSFSVDKYFQRWELPVNQGDVIAYSGNTGGSTAPHLHYEVRRTADQHALDPERYGIQTLDKMPPTFRGLRIEALDTNSKAAPYPAGAMGYAVVPVNDSTYVLKAGSNPAGWGTVGLSVNVIDRYSNSQNTCGIRRLSVLVDGQSVCDIALDEADFGLQRYANAYMDYGLFKEKSLHYNRCYKLPNNRLGVYTPAKSPGLITLEPGLSRQVEVVATDASGNRSTLTFALQGATDAQVAAWPSAKPRGQQLAYDQAATVTLPGMRFQLPPHALYEDTWLTTGASPAPIGAYSPLFTIQDLYTPLQLAGELTIDLPADLPAALLPKLLVARRAGGKWVAEGGTSADGRITASIKTLGPYAVLADTVPPVLSPIGLQPDMKGRKNFKVKVTDNLSGIDQWVAKLDGQWILMEYEPKTNTLEHTFDRYSDRPGSHTFELEVTDERGNVSRLTRSFTR
ncbi:MAG TPA: M23 family metallopeptidase [Flavobacteriales bacterium]|nr:M23 family metallopeptidase [Flavobacteriales bacterium]